MVSDPHDARICEEMGHHSWQNCGLDVPDDGSLAGTLVTITRCLWCGKERRATYKGKGR